MEIRSYRPEDANTILSWCNNERAFYEWTAGVIGNYPISAKEFGFVESLNAFTAYDDDNNIIGFFTLRKPADTADELRVGFVIIDPMLRGKGCGKMLLQLAISQAFRLPGIKAVSLGVFENNLSACHCYRSVGFREITTDQPESYSVLGEEWKCRELRLERISEITLDQARRFILSKQGLLGKHLFTGKDGAYEYVLQAGCIQYDPVDVCGKNAELTLQSRVKGFKKSMLADLLYKDRLLVDYSDKELAIWPSVDWPYFAGYRDRSKAHGSSFKGIPELEEQAIAYIREQGPVSSDTLPIDGKIFWHSSMHWSGSWHKESQAARSVLEQLYTDGVLLIHHKSGSRKYYDLAENHFPSELLNAPFPCADEEAFIRWRIKRRIGAIGLLWNKASSAWLGIDMSTKQRTDAFRKLEENREIFAVRVNGIKPPLYMLVEDLPLLQSVITDTADVKPRLEFLAPLDPMLWDRKLIEALWNFQYSWEIYTSAEKRKYGYYVLPMLYGENLIGRIEAAADRKTGTLIVKNIWLEDGVRKTKKLEKAISSAVKRLAKFNECENVQVLHL